MASNDPVGDAMAAAAGPYAQQPPQGPSDPVGDAMARAAAGQGYATGANATPLDKGSFSPVQAVASAVTGAGAQVLAGGRGIWDLVTAPWGQKVDTAAADISATQNRFTTPMNARTAEVLNSDANPLTWIPKGAQWAGDRTLDLTGSPALATAVQTGINAIPMLAGPQGAEAGGVVRQGARALGTGTKAAINTAGDAVSAARNALFPPPTLDDIASASGMQSPQSMGAAAASPVTQASAPLAAGIRNEARATGGIVNPDTTARHLEADSLPVPIQLSEGQATRDPQLFSNEQNARGADPQLAQQFQGQESKLVQNLRAIRDQVGPEVFSANPVEHGDTLISAYKAKDAAAQADISAKYQALTDANGGQLPMDGQAFVNSAQAALKQQMKAPFLPSGVSSVMQGFSNGEPMTFENFENLRTTLAAEARKADRSGDGNAAAAVGIVRNQLENMPVDSDVAGVKALADTARTAAKARFDALRADPAYAAAVNDTVAPDQFVQKFVTGPGATRDNVATMRANLADNPTATQTMGVAAIDSLRQSAGIDPLDNGRFRQSGFNRQFQALSPKLSSLVDSATAENLEKVGNVARNIQEQPAGAYVNNSNTLTGAMAEHAKGAIEQAANYAAGGIPVGTWARQVYAKRAAGKQAAQVFRPAAGVGRLSESDK